MNNVQQRPESLSLDKKESNTYIPRHNTMPETTNTNAQTQTETAASKPKPCCVCKPEKEARDECLLFNGQDNGKCDELIAKYKTCMKGYGFDI